MRNERKLVWAALCASGLFACSGGGNVNIGNTAVVGGQLSDYAASWDGYAEAYTFWPDNTDHVHLTIDANGQGTLQVGSIPLFPAPTDPNVGFPTGISSVTGSIVLSGGVLYPLYAAQVQTDRIQVGINPADLDAAWCPLQTPYAWTANTGSRLPDAAAPTTIYNCLPDDGFTFGPPNDCALNQSDGTSTPVDCDKLMLCIRAPVCDCTASGCTARSEPAGTLVNEYPVELDGALDDTGKTLTATLNLAGTRITVVLTKQ
jgi:hypothetical protein